MGDDRPKPSYVPYDPPRPDPDLERKDPDEFVVWE